MPSATYRGLQLLVVILAEEPLQKGDVDPNHLVLDLDRHHDAQRLAQIHVAQPIGQRLMNGRRLRQGLSIVEHSFDVEQSSASMALRHASSTSSPDETHPGKSGKTIPYPPLPSGSTTAG